MIDDLKIEFVKENRKNIRISVIEPCTIKIVSPKNLSEKEIKDILYKHKRWISKRLNIITKNKFEPKKFVENEKLLILGKIFFISFDENCRKPILKEDKFLISYLVLPRWKVVIENWYKEKALQIFDNRLKKYSQIMKVEFKDFKLSNAKTRWGSCSSLKTINLSWRLIMAPIEVIDYVVIHELTHLLQMNHSSKFWNIVAKIQPNYNEQKIWLKNNGHLLNL
jgi:predicted metal-dependent hydrolase